MNSSHSFDGIPKDQTIHYKGHGQLESSPASLSVLHVISHEMGHVAEFRSQAHRDGAEIRDIDVDIRYEIRDGRLVAVGGETKVTSAYRKEVDEGKEKPDFDVVDVEPIPSDEDIIQERLKNIQAEMNILLAKSLFTNSGSRSLTDLNDEKKIRAVENSREFLQNRLHELKSKEERTIAESIRHKVFSSQQDQKALQISLGLAPLDIGNRLNLLA